MRSIQASFLFLRAWGLMVGGIVGVGVFALPFVFAKSGFVVAAIELCVMAGVLLFVHLMHAELAVHTRGTHRLAGFATEYLGPFAGAGTFLALSANIWGAMLAYMLLGGEFLYFLLSPVFGGEMSTYSLVLWVIAGLFLWRGGGFVTKFEGVIVGVLLGLFGLIALASLPHVQVVHLTYVNMPHLFLPMGAILFALSSAGIVPEMRELLGGRAKALLAPAIVHGLLAIVILYLLFAFTVVGVTGAQTTQTAFDGLIPVLGSSFRFVGSALGSLTVLSIFLMVGMQMKHLLTVDMQQSKFGAWLMTMGVPLCLFMLGVREFTTLVGFVGSVFGSLLQMIIIACYIAHRRRHRDRSHVIHVPLPFAWIAFLFFAIGLIVPLVKVLL